MPIYNRRAPEKGLARRSLIQWASQKEDFSMNQRSTGLSVAQDAYTGGVLMNRRPSGLSVAKALSGFQQYKGAEGVSQRTMVGSEHALKLWIEARSLFRRRVVGSRWRQPTAC